MTPKQKIKLNSMIQKVSAAEVKASLAESKPEYKVLRDIVRKERERLLDYIDRILIGRNVG
jgi:hypothetical protein